MMDALLSTNDQQEALSRAYVAAVAARAGYVTALQDFDRDGVDIQIRAGGAMNPSLDIQLKATINLGIPSNGIFRYPLKRRNYDLLRKETCVPRILVVLDLPSDLKSQLIITPKALVLQRCAYWQSLLGQPETDNEESVTISISQQRRFDINGLAALMEMARTGNVA
jgi:hypothetical protein